MWCYERIFHHELGHYKVGISIEIIEFYAESYYHFFTLSFLNFLSDAKFGYYI